MYIFYAIIAAFFSGLTTIFSKYGLNNTNSNVVTAIRTIIIFIFSFIIFLIFKNSFHELNLNNSLFLILSGITTALLWLFYFKALSLSDISKVTPVDKTSVILTLILSFIFFNEKITIYKIFSIIFLILGSYLMVKKTHKVKNNNWFIYALLTAVFTSISTILAKLGLKDINFYLANLFRTFIVLIITWIYIYLKKEYKDIKDISLKNYIFILLSGISTTLSWIFYFIALKEGDASIVFPIEKLSAVFAIIGSVIFLKERLSYKNVIGFIFIIVSVIILAIFK